MKFYDLFSGIGGFRLGLERSKHLCIGSCEIDKYATQVYNKNFGEENKTRDVRQIQPKELPDFDILSAGFPCQAFSYAGKRMGFNDTRGTLFFEIVRIAAEKRPQIIFLENVKGLLNHNRGRTFGTIINTLYELGYDVEWQTINGKYFVSQNRERVFIIGHSREKPTRKIFPITESCEINDRTQQEKQGEGEWIRNEYSNCLLSGEGTNSRQHIRTIDSNYYKGGGSRTMILAAHTKANIKQRVQDRNKTWILDTSSSKQMIVDENSKIRKLTPLECERLMGFPDGWTDVGIADTQRYKCLGNSVIPYIIQMIGNEIQ